MKAVRLLVFFLEILGVVASGLNSSERKAVGFEATCFSEKNLLIFLASNSNEGSVFRPESDTTIRQIIIQTHTRTHTNKSRLTRL